MTIQQSGHLLVRLPRAHFNALHAARFAPKRSDSSFVGAIALFRHDDLHQSEMEDHAARGQTSSDTFDVGGFWTSDDQYRHAVPGVSSQVQELYYKA
jgi:hypothetical protein